MGYKDAETNKQYNKAARDRCRELGICIRCQKRDALEGRTVCAECIESGKKATLAWYERNKEKVLQMQKKRQEKYKKTGICIQCGKRPSLPGMTRCEICREDSNHRKRVAYRYARLREGRAMRPRKMGF